MDFVNVFVDDEGRHGNALAIVSNSVGISDDEATLMAVRAGTSETVFVDDPATGRVRIFVPTGRVPFAGHPLVGVGWYLARQGQHLDTLVTDSGPVPVTADGDSCTIVAQAGRGVPWKLVQLRDVEAVTRADSSGPGRHDYVWAWSDESRGIVRARAFTSISGTPEDQATGSAVVELCAQVARPLRITQGRGSVIDVRPHGDRYALSGKVRPAR